MGLSSFFKMFASKDKTLYSFFEEVTYNLTIMSDTFYNALNETDATLRIEQLRKLEVLEHKNDVVTHNIFIELGKNFITPFDREDVHALATALDDVSDYIWGSAKRIINYQIDSVDEVMLNLARVIGHCTNSLHTGVHELRNMKNVRAITDACVAINKFENDADDILDRAIVVLFSTHGMNPIELIKRKDLYQEMEIVTDKCEDAANVIESIMIKYA